MLEKRKELMNILSKDKKKFYNLLSQDIKGLLPIVYTPLIAEAVKKYTGYSENIISINDNLEEKIQNICKGKEYKLVLLTDAEAILGIGDWGINGIEIVKGKSIIYSLCNIDPKYILSIGLDVGTDNNMLLSNKDYMGIKEKRYRGEQYKSFIDKLLYLFHKELDNPLFHFEDFGHINAKYILDTYRDKYLCFNDDVEGTAVVVLSGILSSLKIKKEKLKDQIYLCFGAGTAGLGIAHLVYNAMLLEGLSVKEAKDRIYLFDKKRTFR